MAEVMVGARLASCEASADAQTLAREVAQLFVRETSRFRAYREQDEEKQTLARLWDGELAQDAAAGPWLVRRRPPGSDTLEGRAGETTYSLTMGFRAAYILEPRRWNVRVASDDPTWIEVTKLDAGWNSAGGPLRFPWGLWDLVVRLMSWELVGYTEATLHGPMWQTGSEGISNGLAEEYMADLLSKLMEVRPILRPAYACLGEEYPFKDANVTFRIRQRIPRLSWVNVFGPSYVTKYGRPFLLGAPGYRVEELEDGSIYYQLSERFFQDPEDAAAADALAQKVRSYFSTNPLARGAGYRPTYLRPVTKHKGRNEGREKTPGKTIDPLREANACVSTFRDSFGIILEYSPESLREVDRAISEFLSETEEPTRATLLMLGSYAGEVVRRSVGGNWHISEPFTESSIEDLRHIQALWPYQRVLKRFEEGKASSVYDWYRALVEIESRP